MNYNHMEKANIAFAIILAVFLGQNCSKVDFSSNQATNSKLSPFGDKDSANGHLSDQDSDNDDTDLDDDSDNDSDDSSSDKETASNGHCRGIKIVDVVLHVQHLGASGLRNKHESVELINHMNSELRLADMHSGIPLVTHESRSLNHFEIGLARTGNYAVGENGEKIPLSTTRHQQAGLKLQFSGATTFETGKIHKLTIPFNLMTHIVKHGQGCRVKEVIHGAYLD